MDYDIVIIGAGVVGLAIAMNFSAQGKKCLVVEKNSSFGMETSSRNSEVIHAGIYYSADSLKSTLCIEGNKLLYQWLENTKSKYEINYNKIGKYIIANSDNEIEKLENIYYSAISKGVPGLSLISGKEMSTLEKNIICSSAILSETTGIIDSHQLMTSFYDSASENDTDFAFNHTFKAIEKKQDHYKISIEYNDDNQTENFDLECKYLINSAGLNSDEIAKICGIDIEKENLTLNYSKGCYFRINSYKNIASKLVYPVPPDNAKSLGIHFTIETNGGTKLGPDANYISRDSYDYTVNPESINKFYESASKYIKNLKIEHLSPDQSGIRPKLQKPNEKFRDFIIRDETKNGLPNFINLIGIESPGLTSCIAIAKYLEKFID